MRHATLAVALLASSGCKELANLPNMKELLPRVRFSDMKVEDLTFQKLDGKMVLEIDNPYPVGLALKKTSWKLGLAGHPFLDGTDSEGLDIKAADTGLLRIPFTMKFLDAFQVAQGLGDADQIPFDLDTELAFDTPVGPVQIPLRHEGRLPALHAPQVRLRGLRIEKLNILKNEASLAVDLGLHSDQASALSFETFKWGLKLAGNDVASGNTTIGEIVGDKDVTLPIDLDLLGIGEVVLGALTKKTPLKVRLTADADVKTPFGVVPLAIDELADLTPK